MKRINSAASLLKSIGGTAEMVGRCIDMGTADCGHQVKQRSNPAGSKVSRQIKRGNKGLTCRNGFPINQKVA